MSLVKCRECGKEVSRSAKICPHCGVKNPAPESLAHGVVKWFVVVVFAMVVVSCVAALSGGDGVPTAPAQTQEQKAKKEAEERRFQGVVSVLRAIKTAAHDPASVEFVEIGLVAEKVVCVTARAKNRFGALTLSQVAYQLDGRSLDYSKACAGKTAEDMKHARRAI